MTANPIITPTTSELRWLKGPKIESRGSHPARARIADGPIQPALDTGRPRGRVHHVRLQRPHHLAMPEVQPAQAEPALLIGAHGLPPADPIGPLCPRHRFI